MKIAFTISIILFMLVSCGKERSIKIKAINAATGQPYTGLEYRIASSRTAADGKNTVQKQVAYWIPMVKQSQISNRRKATAPF